MLSMALARNWARKLDTYSWSFLSSLSRILAVCRSMASIRLSQVGSMLVRSVLSLYHAGGFASSLAVGTEAVL